MIEKKLKQICSILLVVTLFVLSVSVTADDAERDAQPPPEIVIDAPPPTQSPVKQEHENVETETVTIYDSKVLPGFRPCTTKDYQNSDIDPVACEDTEEARVISTREANPISEDLIVEDDAVPQGNIFKLKFERFKRKKTQ